MLLNLIFSDSKNTKWKGGPPIKINRPTTMKISLKYSQNCRVVFSIDKTSEFPEREWAEKPTNRKDKVDPALLRSGRIGKHIEVEVPSVGAVEAIWRYYISQIPDSYKIDHIRNSTEELANHSLNVPLSGSDIESIVTSYIKIPLIQGKKVKILDVKGAISEYVTKNREADIYAEDKS